MKRPNILLAITALVGISVLLTVAQFSNAAEPDNEKNKAKPVFSVSEYDPKRAPVKDLAETVKLAQKDNRSIMLLVVGTWCPWCLMIPKYFEKTEPVAAILSSDYVIMKVNDSNTDFLRQYPTIPAYPHLIVLDADGKHLHSQDSEELEKGNGYDEDEFVTFLKKWAPK